MKKLFGSWKKAGFTLMELLVVIAIIALLLAILLPALKKAREQAKRAVCASNEKEICTAIVAFADDNDGQVPPLTLDPTSGEPDNIQGANYLARWFHKQSGNEYWNLGFLWRDGYIKQGKVFYCPSSRYFRYKDYSNPVFPTDIPGGTMGVRVPYSYNPICISVTNRERKFKRITEFTHSNSLVIVDVLGEGGVAHLNGWNVAHGDMSVHFVIDETILDIIANSSNFMGLDFAAWDEVMGKFLEQ